MAYSVFRGFSVDISKSKSGLISHLPSDDKLICCRKIERGLRTKRQRGPNIPVKCHKMGNLHIHSVFLVSEMSHAKQLTSLSAICGFGSSGEYAQRTVQFSNICFLSQTYLLQSFSFRQGQFKARLVSKEVSLLNHQLAIL